MYFVIHKLLIFTLCGLILAKKKDNTQETIGIIKEFIKEENRDQNKLDNILSRGRMAGFYYALDFYEIITELHYEFPEYLTDLIVIGRSFQNRELKAFKLGDLGFNKKN